MTILPKWAHSLLALVGAAIFIASVLPSTGLPSWAVMVLGAVGLALIVVGLQPLFARGGVRGSSSGQMNQPTTGGILNILGSSAMVAILIAAVGVMALWTNVPAKLSIALVIAGEALLLVATIWRIVNAVQSRHRRGHRVRTGD